MGTKIRNRPSLTSVTFLAMLSVYQILAPAMDDTSSSGVGKANTLTPLDTSLNGPTMDAHQIRLGTYGNWLYGNASLPSRPLSKYCANP
jgi:hypothetical protein